MDEPSLICFVSEYSVLRNHDEGLRSLEVLGHLFPSSIRVTLPTIEELTTNCALEPEEGNEKLPMWRTGSLSRRGSRCPPSETPDSLARKIALPGPSKFVTNSDYQ